MKLSKLNFLLGHTTWFVVSILTCPTLAQDISLNYERLSSVEEPLATEIGDVTFTLTGVVDAPVTFDLAGDEDPDPGFIGNFQVGAETQLPNRWTLGVTYFGQYETDPETSIVNGVETEDDRYTDNVAVSLGGTWGTALGGNVSGIVREETRRARGAGNAALEFDGSLAELEDWSGGYRGRYGPVVVSGVVDEDANFDLGATFQRPLGDKDYRLSARYTDGTYTSADGTTEFDVRGIETVAELTYGSMTFDTGVGYDNFASSTADADRAYVSAGARWKTGPVTLSLEGHYGQIDGEDELSASAGLQYDIARGLSANVGLNYAESEAEIGGITFVDTDEKSATVSLRYSF